MIAQTKKTIKRRKNSGWSPIPFFLISGIILASIFLGYSNLRIYQQRLSLNDKLKKLDRETAVLMEKNRLLKKEISDLSNPAAIEEAAREGLVMKKPGEEVVVVIPPEEKPAPEPEKELNWWQKIIRMIGL